MDSIGSILRNRRCERALSLEEAHHATKITLQNLAALEDDQFDSFPNRVYARAFLRDYANYLGLESAPLLERYEAEWGPKDEPEVAETNRERTGRRGILLPAVGALAIIAVAVAVFIAADYQPITLLRAKATSWVERRPVASTHSPNQEDRAISARVPSPTVGPEPPKAPIAPKPYKPQGLSLTVTATQEAWIRVESDSARVFEGTLAAGQSRTWTARRQLKVRTGNAGGIRVNLNGKDLGVMGPSGQIRTKVFFGGTLSERTRQDTGGRREQTFSP